jgi:hypothetical protein
MNRGGFSTSLRMNILQFNGGLFADAAALPLNRDQLQLLIEAARATGARSSPPSSAPCSNAPSTPSSATSSAPTTPPAPTSNASSSPPSSSPCAPTGTPSSAAAITQPPPATRRPPPRSAPSTSASANPRPRPRLRLRQLPLRHPRTPQAHRGRGARLPRPPSANAGPARPAGETVDPTSSSASRSTPAPPPSPNSSSGSATLQWHFRNRGSVHPPQPIIRNFHNIENRDALLDCDRVEPLPGPDGQPLTRWDGRTTKPHAADYVVGNPPFIGKLYQFRTLGEGYVEALRKTYDNAVPGGADYVMYWWHRAAEIVRDGRAKRFGFITTNSIRQSFNRRVLRNALTNAEPVQIVFAIADHPWVDAALGAAVRIAMTVGIKGESENSNGILLEGHQESTTGDGSVAVQFRSRSGRITESLTIGADLAAAVPLFANSAIASMGPALGSRGFVVTEEQRERLIEVDGRGVAPRIRPLRNGRDFLDGPRNLFAVDVCDLDEHALRESFPATYQHLCDLVRPSRAQNRDPRLRKHWWMFRRSNELFRAMLDGLPRFIPLSAHLGMDFSEFPGG